MAKKKDPTFDNETTLDLGNLNFLNDSGGLTTKPIDPEPKAKEEPSSKVSPKPAPKKDEQPKEPKKPKAKAKQKEKPEKTPKSSSKKNTRAGEASNQSGSERTNLRLDVAKLDIDAFKALNEKFLAKTDLYFSVTNTSQFFTLATSFLEFKYKSNKSYFEAAPGFVGYVGRKGNRPTTEESISRKEDSESIFLALQGETCNTYLNLMFSFLKQRGDIHNKSYSVSFFFRDFIALLNDNFKGFCAYGKKHNAVNI